MNNQTYITVQEQLKDLDWASLVLIGAYDPHYENLDVAINMIEVIAERGEPKAKEVANKILNSYQARAFLERVRAVSAITNPLKRQTA